MYKPVTLPNRPITPQVIDSLREIVAFRSGCMPADLRDRVHMTDRLGVERVNTRTVEARERCEPNEPVSYSEACEKKALLP